MCLWRNAWPAAIGACSGCGFPMRKADGGVLYKKVCVDGPVFPMGEVIFHG